MEESQKPTKGLRKFNYIKMVSKEIDIKDIKLKTKKSSEQKSVMTWKLYTQSFTSKSPKQFTIKTKLDHTVNTMLKDSLSYYILQDAKTIK